MLNRIIHRFRHFFRHTTRIEMLSKDDAHMMFGMPLDQWNENVRRAVKAGVSRASGDPELGLNMLTETAPGCVLGVQPSYDESPKRPKFIVVTVGYADPVPAFLTEKVLNDAIEAAKNQMAPEYEVVGNVAQIPGGVSIGFTVIEAD